MNKKPPFELFERRFFVFRCSLCIFRISTRYPLDILSESPRAKNYALSRHDMPEPSGISHNKGLPIGSPLTLLGFNIELTEFVNVNR